MNRLPESTRVQIVTALCEGVSLRGTARIAGVSLNTVSKLLLDIAEACAAYHSRNLVELPCQRIQADEIWSFVGMKAKNVPQERKGEWGVGDVWTFTAIDADSKLLVSYMVGSRDGGTATEFITDVAARLAHRVQLTTDGHAMYLDAVADAFGPAVDYAMLVKHYGPSPDPEHRYSPAECVGASKRTIEGKPDAAHISTSYVERANLTMRMNMRRFTRLTNAFSKKVENHAAAVALYAMHYNFCKVHKSLKTANGYPRTPAMAAGLTDHVWTIGELVGLLALIEVANPPVPARKGGRPRKIGNSN